MRHPEQTSQREAWELAVLQHAWQFCEFVFPRRFESLNAFLNWVKTPEGRQWDGKYPMIAEAERIMSLHPDWQQLNLTFNQVESGSSPERPIQLKSHPDPLLNDHQDSPQLADPYVIIDSDADETSPVAGAPALRGAIVPVDAQLQSHLGPADAAGGEGVVRTQRAIQEFINSRLSKKLKPVTINWYQAFLRRFAAIYPKLPTDPIPIEEFLAQVKGEPETVHANYRTLKALYRFICRRRRWHNPMEFVEPPRRSKKRKATLEPREMMQLLNLSTSLRDSAMLSLFIDCGPRASEVAGLHPHDIKEDSVQVTGKSGQREIPISDETRRLLLALVATQPGKEYVFNNSRGQPMTRHGYYWIIRNYMRQAGIKGPKLGPHRLRHAFGKGYIVSGGDTRSLQKIMGHSSITTTEEYIELSPKDTLEKHHKFTPLRAAHAAAQESLWMEEAMKEAEGIINNRKGP